MKVLVVGDIHGYFDMLSRFLNKDETKYDYIFCCGDFGYWPGYRRFEDIKLSENTKLFFADGNHERHDLLKNLESNEIIPNVFYMKRGSVLTIENKNILFFGGADSIDKAYRTPGHDWFPEENISYADMLNLPPETTKIDMVISHTCPTEFDLKGIVFFKDKMKDTNRIYLSEILTLYRPSFWFFGHWHQCFEGKYLNTKWYGLDCIPNLGWYKEIEIKE
jgi:predicted phosphodiesterase